MPYPGIEPGSDTETKLERCVKSVMAKNPGWDKSRAIATCRSSMKKSEGTMPKTKNGKTARQRRKELARKPEAKMLADDPMADIEAEYYGVDDFLKEHPYEEEKYYDDAPVMIVDPPTDFEELDADREAAEKAEHIRETARDAQHLLSNIVHHPMLDPSEKEEKIKKVGTDFASRLSSYVSEEEKECECEVDEKALDIVEAEMWDRIGGEDSILFRIKAKISVASRNDLPDSDFAYIEPGGTKDDSGKTAPRSLRHYPIQDEAHVRNALSRIAQAIKRGGKSAEIAKKAQSNVRDAAKKFGIGKAGKDMKNGILVEKDTEGTYRWIGWVTNNFRDREKEIISEDAHKEFIEYLNTHPEQAPEFWTWHTKGTARQSKADVWLYHKGFVIMSGPLTDIEAYRLMKAISEDDIGMSHGFIGWKDPKDPTVITKYRSYEVSDLPIKFAANPWTSIEATIKEVSSMSNDKLEYLKKLTSDEYVEGLLLEAEDAKTLLDDLGVESKDIEEEPVEDEVEETPEIGKAISEYFGEDAGDLKEFIAIAKKMLPKMAEEIVGLKEELQKSAEETLADMLESPNSKRTKALDSRPSEDEKNLDESDEFKPPQVEDAAALWLSNITKTKPVYEKEV